MAVACWIYWPTLRGDWLRDDDIYITDNPLLQDPARLWKAWLVPGSFVEYYPIEQTVQWLQWKLWQNDTLGYHITNVALHLLSALLVWRLLSKMGLREAWLGGLIFVLHPVMVESVAWISELKNTLSLPPFLLAMIAWIDYENHQDRHDYLKALGYFLMAMLCKVSMAPFPLVLLLYAWWKRGCVRWSDLRDSAPFFGVSLVLGLVTFLSGLWFLQNQMLPPEAVPPAGFLSRLACAGSVLAFYLRLAIWPADLMPYYPKWSIDPPSLWQFVPWLIWIALLGWFWKMRKRWGRHALLGCGFFFVNLLPFLGFKWISYMRYSWVMDHFLYIPMVGLIGLVVAAWTWLQDKISPGIRRWSQVVMTTVLGLLAWQSQAYAQVFLNEETLWNYMLNRAPDSWLAHNNVGNVLLNQGNVVAAGEHFQNAVLLNPQSYEAQTNLGIVYAFHQQWPQAIGQFQLALRINPGYMQARNDLAVAWFSMGRTAEAMAVDQEELRIKPNDPVAHNDLGLVLKKLGRIPEALKQFQAAVSDAPAYPEAQNNWGLCLAATGDNFSAMVHYQQALRIKPDYAEAHFNLGNALAETGHATEASMEYLAAIRVKPGYPEAHQNLGCTLGQLGRTAEAIAQLREAIRLKPGYTVARANLAKMEASIKASGKK